MNNYFSDKELSCRCCGVNKFKSLTKDRLNALREHVGFAIKLNRGYSCKAHNEAIGATNTHETGQAVDISCTHKEAFELMRVAPQYGFTGIGIKQKGSGRFLHLDDLEELLPRRPRPHLWSY